MHSASHIFKAFHEHSLIYCHWKSNEHLGEGLRGETDLDVLVSHDQSAECGKLLRETGFRQVYSPPWAQYPGIEDWLGFDQTTGKSLHIHLHYRLLVGRKFVKEIHLPWAEYVLRTRVMDPATGVYVADPNIELILLALRIGIKTRWSTLLIAMLSGRMVIPKNIHAEISYLLHHSEAEKIKICCETFFNSKSAEKVVDAIECLRKKHTPRHILRLMMLSRSILARYRRFSLSRAFLQYVVRTVWLRSARILKRFGANIQTKKNLGADNGLVIAVLGADGAGKSTLVLKMHEWLSWKLEARVLYLGRHWLFRILERIRHAIEKTPSARTNATKTTGKGRQRSLIRTLVSDIRKLLNAYGRHTAVQKMLRFKKQGYVVVTDRFPQMQFCGINDSPSIQAGSAHSRIHHVFRRIELRLYKQMCAVPPDIVIKLHVSEETAVTRKPDHHAKTIAVKADIVRRLAFTNSVAIDIDTDGVSADEVALQTKVALWKHVAHTV